MTKPQTAPANISAPPGRTGAMRLPVLLGATGLASTVLLHFRDPHGGGSYGFCPFKYLTGLECPGCGGLRAVNDLTGLDLGAALSSNILAVALVAVVGVAYLRWLPKRWRGERARMIALNPHVTNLLIAVIVVFTVVRNTPGGQGSRPDRHRATPTGRCACKRPVGRRPDLPYPRRTLLGRGRPRCSNAVSPANACEYPRSYGRSPGRTQGSYG